MEALGWLRELSNSDKHYVATFSFTGMSAESVPEVRVRRLSNVHVRFGTDAGHFGITALQAIAVTVETTLRELETRCPELAAS